MSAVGKVHPALVLARQAKHLHEKRSERYTGLSAPVIRIVAPRIGHPPSESYVEHCHQKRNAWRGIVAHVRAHGRARDSHGGAKRDSERAAVRLTLLCRIA